MTRVHPTLPVYQVEGRDGSPVLYAPGTLAVVSSQQAERIRRRWQGQDCDMPAADCAAADALEAAGRDAADRWRAQVEAPFVPECLTVYLSDRCNLRCPYCYSSSGRPDTGARHGAPGGVVDEAVVSSAAALVARGCAARARPFQLVLHGGGDPMVHPELVERLVGMTQCVAEAARIGWFGYVATNGVFSDSTARWLAQHMSCVGLSCDGPPDIQDRQRPTALGGATAARVEQTARCLSDAGGRFAVRATITPATMTRQGEIVEYFCDRLGARDIRLEPLYGWAGGHGPAFAPDDADCFADHFLAAQQSGRARGATVTLSGVRLDELHGPHCNVLRNVLQITPRGLAAPCFLQEQAPDGSGRPFTIGRAAPGRDGFLLDSGLIRALRRQAAAIPSACLDCVNALHCARGCPEVCDLERAPEAEGAASSAAPGGFRCRVHQRVAYAWIVEAAHLAATQPRENGPGEAHG